MASLYINSRLLAFGYQLKAVSLKLIAISFFLTCVGTQNLFAQACGTCATANCSGIKQYANKAAAQAGIGKVWNYYSPALTNAAGTFTVYATVTTDASGQVSVMQEFQIRGATAGITAQAQAIAGTRTYKLFTASDVSCTSGILPANIANDGSSTTFNPAWTNLLPNTNYKIAVTTNLSSIGAYTYEGFNIRFYHAVRPIASFAFNCGTASALGTFRANNIAGQTGTLNVPITGATSGAATFSVTGTGFTGSVTTNIAAGQTSVSIPITYDGTGAAGARTLTVTSSQGTGTCTPSVSVTTLMSTFAFNCGTASTTGTYTANAITGQTGTLTLALSGTTAGQATFSVSGGGFSGSLSSTLTAGQTSVTIPITYNGSGEAGSHLVTITSPQGSGTCARNITVIAPTGVFAFNCGTASVVGSFVANGTAGQGGFVTVPMTTSTAGAATFMVTGAGFSGTLTTTLMNNQTQVSIPITYNGSGAAGAIPLSITSSQGSGTCGLNATVTAVSTAGVITFNCPATAPIVGTFVANSTTQTGLLSINFTTQTAGQITVVVSGNGFTGSYAGSVVAGQTSLTLLVTYDGSGVSGNHAVTVTSSQATGVCAMNIPVQAQFGFACANYNTSSSFTANATSQNGTLVIPLSNTASGSASFTVSGNGFTGSLTTVLQDSQRFVAIPVVYDGTGAAGVHAVSVTSSQASGNCSANVTVKDPALNGCDYLLGQSVSFSVNSQSTYTGYSTQYILVDANGVIRYQTATLPFTGVAVGSYDGYAVNYSGTAPTLTVGTNLSAIGGTCANLSNALPIKMCAAYQFSCGAATYTGVFLANGTGGQTGTLTVTLLNALAVPTTISVSSNGFTGSVTQTLSVGTNTIVIPITFDGTGTGGTKLLTITGTNASGTCATGVDVLPPPPASSFTFTCGSAVINGGFIANNTLQSGSVTIPLTGVVAGTTNFTVTGTGFSGGLTNVVLTAGQTSISIPVEYNGQGPIGSYTIVVNSPKATAACNVSVLVDIDTDGDGIANNVDFDDDNDGIPDLVECPTPTVILTNGTFTGSLAGWTSTGGWLYNAAGFAFNATDGGNNLILKQTATGLNATNIPNQVVVTFDVQSGEGGAQIGHTASLDVYLGGTKYATFNNPAGAGVVTVTLFGGATIANFLPGVAFNTWATGVQLTIPWVSQPNSADLEFRFFASANAQGDDFYLDNIIIERNTNCDADNDGIVNGLDLDSDNDGCSDAFEAGATTSLVANYTFPAPYGANGLADAKETAVDNGIINYTSTYSNAINSAIKTCPSCAAGTIAPSVSATTKSNICGQTTANLSTITASNKPVGTVLTWHTAAAATTANKVADSTAVAAGTYYAAFYDPSFDCYSSATTAVTVTINALPAAPTTTVTQPTCSVTTGTITVNTPSSGVTYSFDNGTTYQASNVKSGLAAGATYQVIVKDNTTGCISVTTPSVINAALAIPSAPTATVTQPTCSVSTGTITVTTPSSGVTYSFDNGTTFQSSNIKSGLAGATTYPIVVKDDISNCVSTATPSVINAALTVPTAPTTTVTQPTCGVTTGTITVTSPSSGVTYSFDNGTTFQPSNIKSGLAAATTYPIIVKDDISNCVSTATPSVINAILTVPTAPTNVTVVSQPTCSMATSSVSMDGMPSSGTWTLTRLNTTTSATFVVTTTGSGSTFYYGNVPTGTYTYTVKDNASGCESTPSNSITVNAQPASPIISGVAKTDPSVSSCPLMNNGTITITATGSNLQYSKDNGTTWQATNVFIGVTANSYIVKVRDSVNTCEASYVTNPVVLAAPTCPANCVVPKPSIVNH